MSAEGVSGAVVPAVLVPAVTGTDLVDSMRRAGRGGIEASAHPAVTYLNGLGPGSRRTMCNALATMARIALGGDELAGDRTNVGYRSTGLAAIGGSVDMDTVPPDLPADRSFLMDLYAASAVEYMQRSGATVEDFARVVVKNQHNGGLNPFAQYGNTLTVEDVLPRA